MCDGITGSLTNQETVELVQERILFRSGNLNNSGEGNKASTLVTSELLSNVCGDICEFCVAEDMEESEDGSGCDNETFMIVKIDRLLKAVLEGNASNSFCSSSSSSSGGSKTLAEKRKEDADVKYKPVVVELPGLPEVEKKKKKKRSLEVGDGKSDDEVPVSKRRKVVE